MCSGSLRKYGPVIANKRTMQKEPSLYHLSNQTASPTKNAACNCPHWCEGSKSCMLVKEGLFLPIQEHIIAYCTSQYYPSCQHYQLLAHPQPPPLKDDQLSINRRRSIRVPRYHLFRFSELCTNNQCTENREEETWTIDVSEHGIRFASYRLLTPDTHILYALERENMAQSRGRGRVIWSRPLDNTPMFHAAISLTE